MLTFADPEPGLWLLATSFEGFFDVFFADAALTCTWKSGGTVLASHATTLPAASGQRTVSFVSVAAVSTSSSPLELYCAYPTSAFVFGLEGKTDAAVLAVPTP